ncbi:MAG TPA: glutathione S-transferase [Microvirga sp.]|nr:glutathione S-transferase [Microvirga sp.]
MITVFGRASSINVRKVLWLCDELELPIVREEWGSGFRDTQEPEFLELNPNALVPVIRDGAHVLWESNAICRYLAAREQRVDLLPASPIERSRVEQWMDWQATELNGSWRYAFMALVRRSAAHADPDSIAASVHAWNRNMDILDAQLRRTDAFVCGGTFTLADIVLGLSVNRWLSTPIARPHLSAVATYFERLTKRPAFLKHGANGIP